MRPEPTRPWLQTGRDLRHRLRQRTPRYELVGLIVAVVLGPATAWYIGPTIGVDLSGLRAAPEALGFVDPPTPLEGSSATRLIQMGPVATDLIGPASEAPDR
jgi:hypothetical protein